MGVFRLYVDIVKHFITHPSDFSSQSLDSIASVYSPYAYIGSRKSLESIVLRETEQIRNCSNVPSSNDREIAAWWFGTSKWQVDSGAFPDFVLAWQGTGSVGDGALLELKDSKGLSIASFNSTLPTACKSLDKLSLIVRESVSRYENCFHQSPPSERDCFYFIRTHKHESSKCRFSLVQGTFFETLPTTELLGELWKQVLSDANIPEDLQQQIIRHLSLLDRAAIAQTRLIPHASVKPRLRIMSEIHSEANPHTYSEIPPRSINLIVKSPNATAALTNLQAWVKEQFQKEGIEVKQEGHDLSFNNSIHAKIVQIQHRRNGLHIAIQTTI